MTPQRFRLVKHLTALAFALAMSGVFVLGVDGLIGGMQRLSRLFASPPPAADTAAAGAGEVTTPGVVPAFIVPAEPAPRGPDREAAAPARPATE